MSAPGEAAEFAQRVAGTWLNQCPVHDAGLKGICNCPTGDPRRVIQILVGMVRELDNQTRLAPHELAALRLFAQGNTVVQIARQLEVPEAIVKKRLQTGRRAYNCVSTAQLVMIGARAGWL